MDMNYTTDLIGKTVSDVEYAEVDGPWGMEPTTTLRFTDGSSFAFVHPVD